MGESEVATSIIVALELRYGAARGGSARLTSQMEAVLGLIPVPPLVGDIDEYYGRLRADLEAHGKPIGGNDMLIAPHALSASTILVTDNVRGFERVDGLRIKNWIREG